MRTSGASIAARAAARSNGAGPPAGPSKTRWPAIAIRSAPGSTRPGDPPARRASSRGRPAASRTARLGQAGVAGGAGDPAPVRVAAVDRRLDQAARDDGPGDRPRVGVVDGRRSPGR